MFKESVIKNNLTTEKFWDSSYKNLNCLEMPENYPIVKEIYNNFQTDQEKTVFEIGCFPGRFLYHFGKLGYELNGIDQTEYLEKMIKWFKENNFKIGEFIKGNIFEFKLDKKYDIVFSTGFIEHFKNFEEVIGIHADLVKNGGYIYLTVPNFVGWLQKLLHSLLDKENLEKHYLPSMNPDKWGFYLEKKGFKIIKKEYVGGFDFWVGNEKRSLLKKIIIKGIRLSLPLRWMPNRQSYSPEIILIAKKK